MKTKYVKETEMTTNGPGPMATWTPTFAMSVEDAKRQVQMKRDFMAGVMKEGMHYGTIPGTPKPSLWKPGAELLLSSMGLHAELTDAAPPTLDMTGRNHNGEPFIEHRRACTIYRQIGPAEHDRMVIARAEGSCSSWEVKYRYRDAKPSCPDCGQETIAKSKAEYGGGWYCNRKAGGCGTNFQPGDDRIASQKLGRIKNPEVADAANTILKMADKRAYVAATLLATGCSDIFTQDVVDEDDEPRDDNETPAGTSRAAGRTNGKAGKTNLSGASDEQTGELDALNAQLPEGKRLSPALLKGKASRPDGYAKTKAELEEMLGKVATQPQPQPPAGPAEQESLV